MHSQYTLEEKYFSGIRVNRLFPPSKKRKKVKTPKPAREHKERPALLKAQRPNREVLLDEGVPGTAMLSAKICLEKFNETYVEFALRACGSVVEIRHASHASDLLAVLLEHFSTKSGHLKSHLSKVKLTNL